MSPVLCLTKLMGDRCLYLLLDLSAAFGTFDHSVLLRRLETNFGIYGMAHKWFWLVFRERFQSVVINGLPSKPALLQYGVPQGSVLSPLLFTLYTQPVSHVIYKHKCGFLKVAYDAQLRKSALPCDFQLLTCRLEYCIKEVKQWMTCNKLKLNDDKTGARTVKTRLEVSFLVVSTSKLVIMIFLKKKNCKKVLVYFLIQVWQWANRWAIFVARPVLKFVD